MTVSIIYLLSPAWGTLNGSTRYTKRKRCKSSPVVDRPEGHTTWAKTVLCCGGLRWLPVGLKLTSSSDSQGLPGAPTRGDLWVTTILRSAEVWGPRSLGDRCLQETSSKCLPNKGPSHSMQMRPSRTADLGLHLLDSGDRTFLGLLPFPRSDNRRCSTEKRESGGKRQIIGRQRGSGQLFGQGCFRQLI